MSAAHTIESKTILGTVSGTVLTVVVNINSSDIIKTVILAALEAVVGFAVRVVLKRVWPIVDSFRNGRKRKK